MTCVHYVDGYCYREFAIGIRLPKCQAHFLNPCEAYMRVINGKTRKKKFLTKPRSGAEVEEGVLPITLKV